MDNYEIKKAELKIQVLSSVAGAKGEEGESMYEIAKKNGFEGTEQEFIAQYMNVNARIGCYECDTDSSTSAKTVQGGKFILPTIPPYGGTIKVKFKYKNSAANPTLSISGCTAKPLYYDGAIASSTNTWADNETVDIYYDGTNFYANNVEGGGKFASGEKVKNVGIDSEPTAGSDNLVKSGGVAKVTGFDSIVFRKGNINGGTGAISTFYSNFIYSGIINGPFEISVNDNYWLYGIWEFASESATTGSRKVLGVDTTNKPKSYIVTDSGLYRVCIQKTDLSDFTFDANNVCTENVIKKISNGLGYTKQDKLVNGTNIKSLGGNSLLGSGNIEIKTVGGNNIIGSGDIDIKSNEIVSNSMAVAYLKGHIFSDFDWTDGYMLLKTNGNPTSYVNGRATLDYYKIEKGDYSAKMNMSGNGAVVCFYDANKTYLNKYEQGNQFEFTVPEDAVYARFSTVKNIANPSLTKISNTSETTEEERIKLFPNTKLPTICFEFDDCAANDDLVYALFNQYHLKCGFAFIANQALILDRGAKYKKWNKEGFSILSHSVDASTFVSKDLTITAVTINGGSGTITTTGAYIDCQFTDIIAGTLTRSTGSGDSSIAYSNITHVSANNYTFTVSGVTNPPSVGDKYSFLYTHQYAQKMIVTSKNRLHNVGMLINGWVSPNSVLDTSFIDIVKSTFAYAATYNDGQYNGRAANPCTTKRESLETNDLATIKTKIDTYISGDRCLVLYGHSANLVENGDTTVWSVAKLSAVLDYCIGKRDACQCYIGSPDECFKYFFELY